MKAGWTTLAVISGSIAIPIVANGAIELTVRRFECIEVDRTETVVTLQCREGTPLVAQESVAPAVTPAVASAIAPAQNWFDPSRYTDARIDGSEAVNLREELAIDRIVTELPRNRLVQIQPVQPIEYRGSRYYFVICYNSPQRGWVAETYLRQP